MPKVTLAPRHTLLGADGNRRCATLVIATRTATIVPVFILSTNVAWDTDATGVTMRALLTLTHGLTLFRAWWLITKSTWWTGTVLLATRAATLVPLFIITTRIHNGTFCNTLTGRIAPEARLAVTHIPLEATLLHVGRT